jgi:hypothetical protein
MKFLIALKVAASLDFPDSGRVRPALTGSS